MNTWNGYENDCRTHRREWELFFEQLFQNSSNYYHESSSNQCSLLVLLPFVLFWMKFAGTVKKINYPKLKTATFQIKVSCENKTFPLECGGRAVEWCRPDDKVYGTRRGLSWCRNHFSFFYGKYSWPRAWMCFKLCYWRYTIEHPVAVERLSTGVSGEVWSPCGAIA